MISKLEDIFRKINGKKFKSCQIPTDKIILVQNECEVDDYIFSTYFEGEGDYKPFDRNFFKMGSTHAGGKAFKDAGLNILDFKKANQALDAFHKFSN